MDVARWILEFLIRNPDNERLAKRALAVMPIPNDDSRLKKIVLLRTIECEVSDASVTEAILDNLESVEELDSGQDAAMADSMKAAYCAVALECTVKFLVSNGGKPGGKYLNALKRVWRGRVSRLERSGESQLFTTDLKRCWDEVEAAIWDDGVCKKLLSRNTRNEAVRLVLEYLKEAWALMGPSFVEWATTLTAKQGGLAQLGDGGVGSRAVESSGNEPEVGVGGVDGAVERREPVAAELASPSRGLRVKGMLELANEVRDQRGSSNDQVCDKAVDVPAGLPNSTDFVISDRPASNVKESLREKVVPRNKQVAFHKRRRGPVRISDVEDSDTDPSDGRCNAIPTPEVIRIHEALKSSCLELRAVVTDPLPEALRVAAAILSDLATKNVNHEPHLESQRGKEADVVNPSVEKRAEPVQSTKDVNHEPPLESPRATEADAANPSVEKSTERVQPSDANLGNPSCSHQNNVLRPSLMARNSTAHTYEWNDSIDDSPESMANGNRLHLPSPKRMAISPLKKYEVKNVSKRRKIKKWSLLEEDTLRNGVQKYGKGNWKLILNSYRDIFEERTEVDLKDKWRNMTR
ncbi:GAMYB transcription factor [Trema orientale]|uniref:GAMYB transcription factor n=1 Tax=Trema orientale TaxID=63057 RepID=A0A2P5CYN7_TREOI|nr:GAMYB transcription factor [Trema orientale]